MKNKGFVLLETIAVLSIICITLITLYSAYIRIIKNVKEQSFYDNTEYIYKTKLIGDLLSSDISSEDIKDKDIFIYCNTAVYRTQANPNPTLVTCNSDSMKYKNLFTAMNVKGVYITTWNTREIDSMSYIEVEPTTQKYLNHINDKRGTGYKIIVMYSDRVSPKKYQYASLRFVPES